MLVVIAQDLANTVVFMLGEVQRDWSMIGRSVVRIFLALDKVRLQWLSSGLMHNNYVCLSLKH